MADIVIQQVIQSGLWAYSLLHKKYTLKKIHKCCQTGSKLKPNTWNSNDVIGVYTSPLKAGRAG